MTACKSGKILYKGVEKFYKLLNNGNMEHKKMTFEERQNFGGSAKAYDPLTKEERQAYIDGKMTQEEFDKLCDERIKSGIFYELK
ncbi:MAG: hypothetical protein NC191_03870 [Muribaculaceae bacterium]|nr:hypothetical protein [Muribaculaceae bacterium]